MAIGHLDCKGGQAELCSDGAAVNLGGIDGDVSVISNGGAIDLQALDNAGVISVRSNGADITCSLSPQLLHKGLVVSAAGRQVSCQVVELVDTSTPSAAEAGRHKDTAAMQLKMYRAHSAKPAGMTGGPMIALHAHCLRPGAPAGTITVKSRSWIDSVKAKVKPESNC